MQVCKKNSINDNDIYMNKSLTRNFINFVEMKYKIHCLEVFSKLVPWNPRVAQNAYINLGTLYVVDIFIDLYPY